MYKYFAGFLIMLAIGWGSYFIINKGLYPVVVVNYKFISNRNLENNYQSALGYYTKIKKQDVSEQDFQKEIRRATLDKLIENILIYEEVNLSDIESQLATIIQQNPNLEQGAVITYGVSWEVFKNLVLRPQVAIEILQKNLQSKNENLNNWLKNKKQSASIWVFSSGLSWNGERVENKQ